jgi:hypothetical protein
MSIAAANFSAGYTGCKVVSNTSANLGSFRGFIVNTTCVISALSGTDTGGQTVNLLTEIGLSGVALSPGIYIPVVDGTLITSITLTSGSVIMYNV